MLREEIVKELIEKIKLLNKEKDLDERLAKMIILQNEIRFKINDEIDELFSEVDLKKRKLNFDDSEF